MTPTKVNDTIGGNKYELTQIHLFSRIGFLGMGNNPMVGATVAIAVAIQQAMN